MSSGLPAKKYTRYVENKGITRLLLIYFFLYLTFAIVVLFMYIITFFFNKDGTSTNAFYQWWKKLYDNYIPLIVLGIGLLVLISLFFLFMIGRKRKITYITTGGTDQFTNSRFAKDFSMIATIISGSGIRYGDVLSLEKIFKRYNIPEPVSNFLDVEKIKGSYVERSYEELSRYLEQFVFIKFLFAWDDKNKTLNNLLDTLHKTYSKYEMDKFSLLKLHSTYASYSILYEHDVKFIISDYDPKFHETFYKIKKIEELLGSQMDN